MNGKNVGEGEQCETGKKQKGKQWRERKKRWERRRESVFSRINELRRGIHVNKKETRRKQEIIGIIGAADGCKA